ncbi:MAG: hypothetical protein JW809_19660 [Pirellulales bacterium]|nr:hypothetical protein [Pirellulales bacterium]
MLGGLKAVVVTESIQTVLLLLGAAAVTGFGLARLAENDTTSLSQLHQRCAEQQAADAAGAADSLRLTAATFAEIERLQRDGRADDAQAALGRLADKLTERQTTKVVLAVLARNGADTLAHRALDARLKGDRSLSWTADTPLADHVEALGEAAEERLVLRQDLATNAGSEKPYSTKLSMIRHDGKFTWWIMLLGYPVIGLWYWCADQTIVQRVLGARSEWDAQTGPIFAGFIKVLPVFLMVFPGVIGYVLLRKEIGENPNATLSVLIRNLLPVGMQGLVLAGLLAALMSTVAGALNSAATLVSVDIVQRLRPRTSDRALVRIGQITAVVVMIVAVAWSTQGDRFGGIFEGINQMISVLAPPITTVFFWGIFWRRGTSAAALATLLAGFALGIVVFVIDFPAFGLEIVTKQWGMPFMLQAFVLFAICSVVFIAMSLFTPPPKPEQVEKYCWKNPLAALTEKRVTGLSDPRVLAVILLAVMAVCYWVFA